MSTELEDLSELFFCLQNLKVADASPNETQGVETSKLRKLKLILGPHIFKETNAKNRNENYETSPRELV
jgi:hypothetical protein